MKNVHYLQKLCSHLKSHCAMHVITLNPSGKYSPVIIPVWLFTWTSRYRFTTREMNYVSSVFTDVIWTSTVLLTRIRNWKSYKKNSFLSSVALYIIHFSFIPFRKQGVWNKEKWRSHSSVSCD